MRELILSRKRDPEQEYTIHLFEYCNLSCAFCWQDHDRTVGVDDVLGKLPSIEAFLQEETKDRVTFNVMGGEVFAPRIFTRELLESYKRFLDGLKELCERYGKTFTVSWVTNLVTDKLDYIDELLAYAAAQGIDSALGTSYDPRGRFNPTNFAQFQDNVRYYHERKQLAGIGMVLTRTNVKYLLQDTDEYFKELYRTGIPIYLDYLMPDRLRTDSPSDAELLELFKFVLVNYPKLQPAAAWLSRKPQPLSCRSSKLVLDDGTRCQCGNLVEPKTAEQIYRVPIEALSNAKIENAFLEKYNCISCEYLTRCQLGCFMQHNYKFREELDDCVYKLTHRFIDTL